MRLAKASLPSTPRTPLEDGVPDALRFAIDCTKAKASFMDCVQTYEYHPLWQVHGSLDKMGLTRQYVAVAGDLVAGSLLSQIVYWHRPNQGGATKLRVKRDGHYWIAKTREGWMAECCITLNQYKRAIDSLEKKGLIERQYFLFKGNRETHIRLIHDNLQKALDDLPPMPSIWEKTY